MSEIELKNCPFCGCPAGFAHNEDEDGDFVAVQCTGCGCGTGKHYPVMDSADGNAACEWNQRIPPPMPPELRELIKRAEKALEGPYPDLDAQDIIEQLLHVVKQGYAQ